jgi:arsenate reductase
VDERSAVDALAALAQGARLRVFRALVAASPAGLTPGVLAAMLGIPGSTLSFHLKGLAHAGLVTARRDGRQLVYRSDLQQMNALLDYLTAQCCGSEPGGLAAFARGAARLFPQRTPTTTGEPTVNPGTLNVLFVCTHNSARSIMAEAIMNSLGAGRFRAWSAGSQPSGEVHPQALKTLEAMHVGANGLRSKDWAEFAQAGAPELHFVITVCDRAAGETCPVWPGQPMTAHWGVADPSAAQGAPDEVARTFWDTAITLRRRIELMLALPMDSLDRISLQRAVTGIGTR